MPLIIPANTLSVASFDVENSCRFNDPDSAYLSRTLGTPSSLTTSTFSAWVKLAKGTATGQYDNKIFQGLGSGGCNGVLSIGGDAAAKIYLYQHDTGCSRAEASYIPTQAFQDYSAWYHIVVTTNTSSGVAADRMILYVNGVRVTAFDTQTTFDSGETVYWNSTSQSQVHYIGKDFDGYLAEVVFCDGQAYGPTDFGEFDSDSPTIWKPKDPSGLTFGTNGFYLDFKDSANLGNDANGGTDWDETNIAAADQATDTPTNNFATFNPLETQSPDTDFSQGNLKFAQSTSDAWESNFATFGITAGKWYWEIKATDIADSGVSLSVGIADDSVNRTTDSKFDAVATGYSYNDSGEKQTNNSGASYGDTFADGDIISVAFDADNLKLYFAKNGTFQDSGDPTTGATGTGAAFTVTSGLTYLPAINTYASTSIEANFGGCPAFAISSGNADANGYGNFEYAVPSGYLALCTKNLGSDGG